MASPPLKPIKTEKENTGYFDKLCDMAKPSLLADGITLNFAGYEETIEDYRNLQEDDIKTAWRLTGELNAWSEYFSDISNLIQKQYLDSETEKIEVQSNKSIESGAKNVSAGDRQANIDTNVILARKKRNCLKSLYDMLSFKIKFLERAYYHCKSTCEWDNKLKTAYVQKTDGGQAR